MSALICLADASNAEYISVVSHNFRDPLVVSYHAGSSENRWEGHAAGRMAPPAARNFQTKGGPGRDHSKCMELQLTKVITFGRLVPLRSYYIDNLGISLILMLK